ncbi:MULTISPECIES: EfeM/EfeO family lipoprotein [Subtercola]|uniref:EfeM/EfeO family lipoprotein n=1 Tax=Subtercola TaxID=120212 RepID=UPI001375FEF8|nr:MULTISPECIES: EfeM/EfeO family lipoprotein [Subtercola]MEA9986046.1 EfeM/EfeO family lipoprotein [Subtercola sp. RTI3]
MKSTPGALALAVVIIALALTGCARSTTGTTGAQAQTVQSEGFVALQLRESNNDFALYARQQAEQLQTATDEFAAAYSSGNDELARSLYAPSRMFYNRLLAVSDSFSDLTARLDLRASDLAPGATLTGWHAVEQDLYPPAGTVPLSAAARSSLARQLSDDTYALNQRIMALRPSVDQQTTGAATLMLTLGLNAASGTQDAASHTDLNDLQGYLDGVRVVFEGIRDVLVTQDAALATTLDHEFDGVQGSLNAERSGVLMKTFDAVAPADRASLQSKVAALASSLAQITPTMGAVTGASQ